MAFLSFQSARIHWKSILIWVFNGLIFTSVRTSVANAERPSQPADYNPSPQLFILCPADLSIGVSGNNCQATVQIPQPQVISNGCNGSPALSVISPMGIGYGPFPGTGCGSFFIKCTASNLCGDTATCSFKIEVKDIKKPTPLLKTAVHGNIAANGLVKFSARQFNQNSFDNCSPASSLRFAFSNDPADSVKTFNCSQLGSFQTSIHVFDEQGNRATGMSQLQVKDGMNYCQNTEIAGQILTPEGKPVSEVKVFAESTVFDEATMTGNDGRFQFLELPAFKPCMVEPFKNDNPLNGLNSFDLSLLHKHLTGEKPLNSPWKIIAADVNASGQVTTADLLEIRNLILGIQSGFSNNKAWRFVLGGQQFANPLNPLATVFQENFSSGSLPKGRSQADFTAIKIGDLNGDVVPNNLQNLGQDERSEAKTIPLIVENQSFKKGDEVRAQFHLPTEPSFQMAAFQFTLNFDMAQLSFKTASPGNLSGMGFENIGSANSDAGEIATVWNGNFPSHPKPNTLIMTTHFIAKSDGQLSDILQLSNRLAPSQCFDENGNMYELKLNFLDKPDGSGGGLNVLTNQPNPFIEMTLLRFSLPEDDEVLIRIFDSKEKLVKEKSGLFQAGENQVLVNRHDIGKPGVYFYSVESRFGSAVRKLVMF